MLTGKMDGRLIGASPPHAPTDEAAMALACALYEQGACAECFRVLLRLSTAGRRTAPLWYNMALCLEDAGQQERAFSCLEKALSGLKGERAPTQPPGEAEVLRILHEQQCGQARYRFPMREDEASCLPDYARERILRLMIDLCAQRNDGSRVRSLAASLAGNHFDNVEKALRQTTEKEA